MKNLQNKAELAQKKAEQATKRAEDAEKKAKDAVNSANTKLAEEVKTLRAEAKEAKEQAEQAKKEAENALNNLEESVKNALDEVEAAREANINKLAKIASQEGYLVAEYLARKNSKLSEEQFKDFLKKRKENYKVLKDQALKAGLTDWEASNFAYDNQDKAKSESDEELKILKAQVEARENKRNKLIILAKNDGL